MRCPGEQRSGCASLKSNLVFAKSAAVIISAFPKMTVAILNTDLV